MMQPRHIDAAASHRPSPAHGLCGGRRRQWPGRTVLCRAQKRDKDSNVALEAGSSPDLRTAYRFLGGLTVLSSFSSGAPLGLPAADLLWLSLLPLELLTFAGTAPGPAPPLSPGDAEDEDDSLAVKWGLITALSCVPFFSWLGWVFAAVDAPDPASRERLWALALLYGLPAGLRLAGLLQSSDATFWGLLVLGVLHLQAERIRETTPSRLPRVDSVARALRGSQGTGGRGGQLPDGVAARLPSWLGGSDPRANPGAGGQQRGAERERRTRERDEEATELRRNKRLQSKELKAWDAQFNQRSKPEE